MEEGGGTTHLTFYQGRFLPTSKVITLGLVHLYSLMMVAIVFYTAYKQEATTHQWITDASIPSVLKIALLLGIPINLFLGRDSMKRKNKSGIFQACIFVCFIFLSLWG